jgi:hypothetical protein
LGIPATPESDQKRLLVAVKRIPAMRDQIQELEKQIESMSAELELLKANVMKNEGAIPHRAAG